MYRTRGLVEIENDKIETLVNWKIHENGVILTDQTLPLVRVHPK